MNQKKHFFGNFVKSLLQFHIVAILLLCIGVASSFADWADDFSGNVYTNPPGGSWTGLNVSIADPGNPTAPLAPLINERVVFDNTSNTGLSGTATAAVFVASSNNNNEHHYLNVQVKGFLGVDDSTNIVTGAPEPNDNSYGLIARGNNFDSYVLAVSNDILNNGNKELFLIKSKNSDPTNPVVFATIEISATPESYLFELDVVNFGNETRLAGRIYSSTTGTLVQQILGLDDGVSDGPTHPAYYSGYFAQINIGGIDSGNPTAAQVANLSSWGDDLSSTSLDMGDATLDHIVNQADVAALLQNYGKSSDGTWIEGDFDLDGKVTLRDLLILKKNYSPVVVAAVAVPEPTMIAMLISGMIALGGYLRSRRKHRFVDV